MASKREAKRRALVKFLDRLPADRGEQARAPQGLRKKVPAEINLPPTLSAAIPPRLPQDK